MSEETTSGVNNTQGERKTSKKKINHFTHAEALAELNRLEQHGHQFSRYYRQVKERAKVTAA